MIMLILGIEGFLQFKTRRISKEATLLIPITKVPQKLDGSRIYTPMHSPFMPNKTVAG